ncbi:MAG: hypothetical protein RL385_6016 [Pseudomonadota bacterium]|jgi:hypothetical protein
MSLRAYQRLFTAHVLGVTSDIPGEIADAGDVALYRAMVQRRLIGLGLTAYRAAVRELGEDAFRQRYARFLALHPPRVPYLRDTVGGFADFLACDAGKSPEDPPYLSSLAAFEALLWRVLYAEPALAFEAAELDFARPPCFCPTTQLFRAAFAVHRRWREPTGAAAPGAVQLLVFRDTADCPRFVAVSPLLAQVFEAAQSRPAASLTELVHAAAVALDCPLDDTLLSDLSDGLTSLLTCGALRGSR